MNKEDREKILHNLMELIEETNLDTLIPALLELGVFTDGMCEKYMVSYVQLFFLCWKPLHFHGALLLFILELLEDGTSVSYIVRYLESLALYGGMARTRYMAGDVLAVGNVFWVMPPSSSEDG
jgi:hypothetical protein